MRLHQSRAKTAIPSSVPAQPYSAWSVGATPVKTSGSELRVALAAAGAVGLVEFDLYDGRPELIWM